jgi:Holliday junction resolvase
MRENHYQAKIIRKLKEMFPGCEVIKTDASYQQGLPDLLILWHGYWAVLEVKSSAEANTQPNQDHYIQKLSTMSFAAYIYPENEKEVLGALQKAFKPPRRARVSQS